MKKAPNGYYYCLQFAEIRKDRLNRVVWICRAVCKTHTKKFNEAGNTFPELPCKLVVTLH